MSVLDPTREQEARVEAISLELRGASLRVSGHRRGTGAIIVESPAGRRWVLGEDGEPACDACGEQRGKVLGRGAYGVQCEYCWDNILEARWEGRG